MFILLSLVFAHFIRLRLKRSMSDVTLKATPAYVPKKRLPKNSRNPIPDYIPTFYY